MENFWDFLRPLTGIAEALSLPVVLLVFIISIIIFAIALAAYMRKKSARLLFVAAAFFIFMAKWLLQLIDQFISPGLFFSIPAQGIVELIIMVLLLLAILKK
jgi:hypothetical protein